MMVRGVLIYLLVALALSAGVRGLNCDNNELPYPPNICLSLASGASDHLTARGTCELVTMVDSEQFVTLARYVEVLLQSETSVWTGYRYNASDVLVSGDNVEVPLGSPVLDDPNYDSSTQPPQRDGTCVAIGLDASNQVKLFRVTCTSVLKYICSESVTVPTVVVSTSGSRFLSQGSPITLTCDVTHSPRTIEWRKDNNIITDESDTTLIIDAFDGSPALYECVVTTRAGSVVSQGVQLNSSAGLESTAPTITELSASSTSVQFGASVDITCSFSAVNSMGQVEWFVNGMLKLTTLLTGTETQDVLTIPNFSEDGVYQCRVFSENGDNSVEEIFISGRAGIPGLVDFPISLTDTQTQVLVSWLHPVTLNVLDSRLLRYDLYYLKGDESVASMQTDIPPLLLNGGVSVSGVVEVALRGLDPGTTYMITIRAKSSAGAGELRDRAIVTTFGEVPTVTVDDSLKVRRTKDNKTLFADWDDVKTTLPTAPVARYWVEYRDSNKGDKSNGVFLNPKYSYLVVSSVEDAQNYQVRVSVGVITKREPLEYSYGPFSKWVEVKGIVETVPPVPPTEPLRPAAGVIAAAVVVPVLGIGLILFVLGFGIFCCCLKRFGKSGSFSPKHNLERKDSQAIGLKPKDLSDFPYKESSPELLS